MLKKDHVYIQLERLRDLLGMTGIVLKVYAEPDADFLHVITLCDEDDPNGLHVPEGGYVEPRAHHQFR